MDSNYEMPATYFIHSLSDESQPRTNEEAYTWFPTMDFGSVWPLDHCDLVAFNACMYYLPWLFAGCVLVV